MGTPPAQAVDSSKLERLFPHHRRRRYQHRQTCAATSRSATKQWCPPTWCATALTGGEARGKGGTARSSGGLPQDQEFDATTARSSFASARFLHEQLTPASPDLLGQMLTTFLGDPQPQAAEHREQARAEVLA
jgi:hypothetical protein